MNKNRYLFVGGVSFCLLTIAAFLVGLTLQNMWFPTPETAAAGWLIFTMPLMGLPALLIGAFMGVLVRRGEQQAKRLRHFVWIMLLGLVVAAIISWGYFWLASLLALLATFITWVLLRKLC